MSIISPTKTKRFCGLFNFVSVLQFNQIFTSLTSFLDVLSPSAVKVANPSISYNTLCTHCWWYSSALIQYVRAVYLMSENVSLPQMGQSHFFRKQVNTKLLGLFTQSIPNSVFAFCYTSCILASNFNVLTEEVVVRLTDEKLCIKECYKYVCNIRLTYCLR